MLNPLCQHCDRASSRLYGGFDGACRGCLARRAARSPDFWQSARDGKQTPAYRNLLRSLGITHADALQAKADDFHPETT